VNHASEALEKACDRFFETYKKEFGAKSKSFLARVDNIEMLLSRIYLDHKGLEPRDLNPDGDEGVPRASTEALHFIINAFEKEIKKDPLLIREIETIKHYRNTEEMDERLRRIEKLLSEQNASHNTGVPHLLTLLPPRKTDLVGRDEDLKELIKLINTNRPLLLVNGLGGIGKSELCKRFIHEHHNQYGHVAWIDYSHSLMDSITTALARLVRAKGNETTEHLFDAIMDRLNNLDHSLLLIIDNIENKSDSHLDQLLGLPCRVIVNSRLQLEGFQVMTLDFLSVEACLELFYRYY
jgi:hypothetical protein